MGERLKGRNAVVSGAGRGIGRAVALALAEEGANIVVCDLGGATDGTGTDQSPADAVVQECKEFGVKAVPHYGDVSDFKAAGDMVKSCVDNFGRIDILCNIAGITRARMIFNMSEEEWDRVVAVNLKGTFNLTRHATPLMREQRYGRLVNTVFEVFLGSAAQSNYSAAKGGIASLTYSIATEMGKYGVTCNAFVPRARTRLVMGEAKAGMEHGFKVGAMTQAEFDEMVGNAAYPEYFAPFIVYMASDAAANINGCLFLASGAAIGYWSKPQIMTQVTRDWEKEGKWTFEEIEKIVPETLLVDYVNPIPPQPEKK